jgi:ComF family protein
MRLENFHKAVDFIVDIFFPNRCPCCRKIIPWEEALCDACAEKLFAYRYNGSSDITVCYYYDGVVVDGIYSLKFAGAKNFARHCAKIISADINADFDYIVPVPIGKKRLRKRGYNQAEVIAKYISRDLQIPIAKDILYRTIEKVQHTLSEKERIKNAEDSYKIRESGSEKVNGKRVLLIDDVYTTGATVSVCKKLLTDAGAVVDAAVCAKTYDKKQE